MAAATSAQEAQQMPFIKNLASSDRKLRTASLSSLQAFLASRRALSPLDASKLWTGLYYALWMTDRPRPQQALATDLAALLFDLRPACAPAWLAGFWAVLGAQWPHIEALRMDKFMLLVRRVFAAHVRFARERGFAGSSGSSSSSDHDDINMDMDKDDDHGKRNQESGDEDEDEGKGGTRNQSKEVGAVLDVLREWCFNPDDGRRVALGLRLHVLDIWVDELEREGALPAAAGAGHSGEEVAQSAASSFVRAVGDMVDELARTTPNKAVRQRARQSYEDERLPWVDAAEEQPDEEEGKDDDDDEWGGLDD